MTTIQRIFPTQEVRCGSVVVGVEKAATVPYQKISSPVDCSTAASGLSILLDKRFFNPPSGLTGRVYQ